LATGLEAGVVRPTSGILCTREIEVAGHRLICTHPDLHRPLRPGEALAYSCNTYFAAVAAQLGRPSFDATLRALGLPASDPAQPLTAAALGVEGIQATPRQLLDMMTR